MSDKKTEQTRLCSYQWEVLEKGVVVHSEHMREDLELRNILESQIEMKKALLTGYKSTF